MPIPASPSSPRIPYDLDGSYVFIQRTVGGSYFQPYELAPAALAAMNSDRGKGLALSPSSWWDFPVNTYNDDPKKNVLTILFPTPMRITEIFLSAWSHFTTSVGAVTYHDFPHLNTIIQTSEDTTNGLDGEWEQALIRDRENVVPDWDSNDTEMRPVLPDGTAPSGGDSIITAGLEMYQPGDEFGLGWFPVFGNGFKNLKGLRLWMDSRPVGTQNNFNLAVLHLHLYGYRDELAAEHRIEFVGDDLRFGDIGTDSTAERIIRLSNVSSSLDATDVDLNVVASYPLETPDPTPSIQISLDGITWASTLNFATIAAGDETPDIHVRLDPVANLLGYRHARLKVEAVVWTP